jgi:nicotinate-nucleotide adenylyltransferase
LVNQSKPTVAIFGGSFDPPHKGHQQIVDNAIKNLVIDKLLVVPAYLNPFKNSSLASALKRLEWCRTLFSNPPKVIVEDYEILQGQSIRTSQTVKHFNMTYNVKYLIIGADNLSTLSQWHAFEALNAQVTWVIVTREGYDLVVDGLREWTLLTLNAAISSTKIREEKDVSHVDTKIEKSVKKTLKETTK